MTTELETEKRPAFPINLVCFLIFGIPCIAALFFGDYVLAGLIFIVAVGCRVGFGVGAIKAAASIALVAAAIYVAPQFTHLVEPKITEMFELTGLASRVAAIAAVVFVVGCAMSISISIFSWIFLKKGNLLDRGNRLTGTLIGGAKAAIAAVLFLGGIQVIEPMIDQRAEETQYTGGLTPLALQAIPIVAQHTRKSVVGEPLATHNPFTKYPEYNPLPTAQQAVTVLSDPAKMNQILDEISLDKIDASPEFAKAIEALNADPTVKEVLESGGAPEFNQLIKILNSPTVMEVIEQPGFLKEANRIIFQSSALASELSVTD